jgi:hypothetical protein
MRCAPYHHLRRCASPTASGSRPCRTERSSPYGSPRGCALPPHAPPAKPQGCPAPICHRQLRLSTGVACEQPPTAADSDASDLRCFAAAALAAYCGTQRHGCDSKPLSFGDVPTDSAAEYGLALSAAQISLLVALLLRTHSGRAEASLSATASSA